MTREMIEGASRLEPADYIAETKRLYDDLGYDSYRWAHNPEPPAWSPIVKPLNESKVMLIGSGGIYKTGQVAFHTKDDTSVRVIDTDTASADLRTAHFAYDQTDARTDANCVFPLDRLRELASSGVIGELASEAYGFMGGIYSTRRMMAETAETLLERCKTHEPDLVLLVPV
jgi:D-proline reductase (dithiol) PrdB